MIIHFTFWFLRIHTLVYVLQLYFIRLSLRSC